MNSANNAAVVVGVDGSESALRAVRLAATEAARRNRPLRVVHGFIWPLLHVPVSPAPDAPPGGGLRHRAEELVEAAVNEAEATVPGLSASGEIIDGEAAAVLVGESPSAALIVLGDRGLGGFSALVVGSVAVQVAAYADCPVLVARGTERPDEPVLVAVDGSDASRRAADFAAETAVSRGVPLVAVHAYRHPGSSGPGDMQPLVYDEAKLRGEQERMLAGWLTGLTDDHRGLRLTCRAVHGRPGSVLAEASRSAQLAVVGGRGRGEVTGLLLGSVSQSMLHHAQCPVVVVRAPQ
ncbi:nucleotide-binding universal stress UspA family protein [Micromonospora vinacea]|uniref:Nucleotide-binding universal stress UspA family protein n=1 Tax=Micromonospora vinacea TaxID=709878 RepID=A0ABS0K7Q1_9ACTN|nr:universal stress protein [Micromonospora vinacea]MBG6104661.1 nucleotide-binding universal stress UspA family protein [Micromonospora vinacea]